MAFYLRDDREPIGFSRVGSHLAFAAPLVMHDRCVACVVPDLPALDDPSPDAVRARMDACDAWADRCGPGHALCWAPVYSLSNSAPACFHCGEQVRGSC